MSGIPPPAVGSGSTATGNYGPNPDYKPTLRDTDLHFADDIEKLKKVVITTALQDEISKLMTGNLFGGEGEAGAQSPLMEALDIKRTQEEHEAKMTDFQIKQKKDLLEIMSNTRSADLDNQKKEFDMEVKLAEAEQKGLLVRTQDPPPVLEPGKQPVSGIPFAGELLDKTTENNLSKGLFDAIEAKKDQLISEGKRKPLDSEASRMDAFMRDELVKALGKASSQKSLRYGPFADTGPLGNLIQIGGGLLDIVTGPLDLGTEIFGGTIGEAGKVELFSRAIAQTSPLVRAEMQDLFQREKMEQTAQRYLERRGMGNLGPHLDAGDMEGAEEMAVTAMDIRKLLQDSVPNSFGTLQTNGMDQALSGYEEIHKLVADLSRANTQAEVEQIEGQLMRAERSMRQPILDFYKNGGTPDQLHDEIVAAIDAIDAKYAQQPLQYLGDSKATKLVAQQRLVAEDFKRKLTELEKEFFDIAPSKEEQKERKEKERKGKGAPLPFSGEAQLQKLSPFGNALKRALSSASGGLF